jgi:hypothetical protein
VKWIILGSVVGSLEHGNETSDSRINFSVRTTFLEPTKKKNNSFLYVTVRRKGYKESIRTKIKLIQRWHSKYPLPNIVHICVGYSVDETFRRAVFP